MSLQVDDIKDGMPDDDAANPGQSYQPQNHDTLPPPPTTARVDHTDRLRRASRRQSFKYLSGSHAVDSITDSHGHQAKRKTVLDRMKDRDPLADLNAHNAPDDGLADDDESFNLEYEMKRKRKIWGGGLYSDPSKPGKTSLKSDCTEHYWRRDPERGTSDFLTLIRRMACAVLSNHGFLIREIFVKNGSQIALILTLPEDNLK